MACGESLKNAGSLKKQTLAATERFAGKAKLCGPTVVSDIWGLNRTACGRWP